MLTNAAAIAIRCLKHLCQYILYFLGIVWIGVAYFDQTRQDKVANLVNYCACVLSTFLVVFLIPV